MSIKTKQFEIHEDWTAVILGFLIIGLSLSIFLLPVPVFKWVNYAQLTEDVFGYGNLKIVLQQFIYLFAIGSFGILLIGKISCWGFQQCIF
jgi:hypothetical protein